MRAELVQLGEEVRPGRCLPTCILGRCMHAAATSTPSASAATLCQSGCSHTCRQLQCTLIPAKRCPAQLPPGVCRQCCAGAAARGGAGAASPDHVPAAAHVRGWAGLGAGTMAERRPRAAGKRCLAPPAVLRTTTPSPLYSPPRDARHSARLNARRPPPLPHRSQHEHLYEAHPYRPFPTEALEAAVAAVPLESYPQQERKLAQFGREFVYFRAPYPPPGQQQQASGSGEGGAGTGRPPLRGARRQRDVAVAAASGSLDASLSSVGSDGEEEGEPGAEPVAALMRPRPPPRQWAPMHAWVRETLAFVAAYPRLAGGQGRKGSCGGC